MTLDAHTSLFSIIIPVYRNEKQLAACLDSIRSQTLEDWECICINGGSTDGRADILDGYSLRDKLPSGVPLAANNNVPACRGRIYKKEFPVKNKIKFPERFKFAEDLYLTAQYFCICTSATVISKPFYQYSTNGETGATRGFFNRRKPPEDFRTALQPVLDLSKCLNGRSPYSRNYFLRNRSLLALFTLSYSDYKFISDRIKTLYPEHEKIRNTCKPASDTLLFS